MTAARVFPLQVHTGELRQTEGGAVLLAPGLPHTSMRRGCRRGQFVHIRRLMSVSASVQGGTAQFSRLTGDPAQNS